MARILAPTDDALALAADQLAAGALVGMPTETVYGLAARALDPEAVARIYAAKDRPRFNPLIAHVAHRPGGLDALDGSVVDLDRLDVPGRRVARALVDAFWPGPLTIVLPRGPDVPDLTTAGLDTVGVRCPDHPVAQALLARVDGPLAAPSANRSGRISPTTAADVASELGEAVALVLDGGPCRVGLESTVVHVAPDGIVTRLRPGAVVDERLAAVLGHPPVLATGTADRPRSPGMTARHYAPDAPFLALPARLDALPPEATSRLDRTLRGRHRVGVLAWTARPITLPGVTVEVVALTDDGEPAQAARRLFAALRTLDALGADLLLAEPCPPHGDAAGGLGHALRDRLRRATTPLVPPPPAH